MSRSTTGFLVRRVLSLAVAAVAVSAFAPLAAQAATAQPSTPNNPNTVAAPAAIANLRAELRAGTLTQSTGVTDLCATAHAACQLEAVTGSTGKPLSTSTPVGYGPADLASAYHLPANSVGQKGTIAIIDAGAYPVLESDLATYRKQYGLPACGTANGCLTIADYQGGAPLPPDTTQLGEAEEEDVAVETSLDVDMASAACPDCRIIELQVPLADGFPATQAANDQATVDFGTAVNTAVKLGASAISMSYQYSPDANTDSGAAAQALFHPGVAILASSGDGGYEGGQTGWPQDLPWVTSVGGTSLYTTNSAGTAFTQVAWSYAGSGCAADEPPAAGQPASVSAYCGGHRASSDVSAVADPSTGVAVYDTYAPYDNTPLNWTVVGGTSVSSPFVAGLYARGGHLSGVVGPNTLYSAKHGLQDVTLGQNAAKGACAADGIANQVCQAGTGWDGPSGLGTPNGLSAF